VPPEQSSAEPGNPSGKTPGTGPNPAGGQSIEERISALSQEDGAIPGENGAEASSAPGEASTDPNAWQPDPSYFAWETVDEAQADAREQEQAPEPEAKEPEGDAEPTVEAEAGDGEQAADDVQEVELTTLDELAEYIELQPADLYNLSLPVTLADGSTVQMSLSELKDGVQSSDKAKETRTEYEQRRQALETQSAQRVRQLDERLAEAEGVVNTAERLMMADMEAIDWHQLRADDPAEWGARRQDFSERLAQVENTKRRLAEEREKLQRENYEQHMTHFRNEVLPAENAALLNAIPAWQDPKVRATEEGKLRTYLGELGFSEQEASSVYDHRALVAARKAMLYDEMQSQVKTAKKKVVKVGKKPLRSGHRQSREQNRADAVVPLRQRLKKSGSVDDAAAVISQMRR
jgi:hypothetical protein